MNKNIPLFKVFMSEDVMEPLSKVLRSGYIGQGPKVEEFETYLRHRFNHDYILSLNTGTNGLHLALRLLQKPETHYIGASKHIWPGLQPGDEILASPLTCTASNWPIVINGYKIKWVDINPHDLNMDLDSLARAITSSTKVIILPFWGGYPADLDQIKVIQQMADAMYGFKPALIEDAAHSMGATYKGHHVGTHGNMTMFSLQAIKHVTSVDGGLLFLPHEELYRRGKLLRWYGIDRESNRKDFRCESDITEIGDKLHMNDVNATIGLENFKYADQIIAAHQRNAEFYNKELKDVPGITLLDYKPDRQSAYWLYTMHVERRHEFMQYMKEHGIATSRVHERNDRHTCTREYISQLPNLEKAIKTMISIPVGWWVSDEDRSYIVETIKNGW